MPRGRWAAIGVMAVTALVLTSATASSAGAAPKPPPTGITVSIKSPIRYFIPKGFVAMTFEVTTLGSAYLDPAQSNLGSFLAQLGQGNLRFGGESSDLYAAWQGTPSTPLPAWATSAVTPAQLSTLAGLASSTGWSVDLGINLFHDDTTAAQQEVQAAKSILGPSLHAVEIGNEPDIYVYFLASAPDPPPNVPTTFAGYETNWDAYLAALKTVGRGVAIAGPDTYLTSWLPSFTNTNEKGLSEFTQHFYPLADCGGTVIGSDQLLSQQAISTEDAVVTAAKLAALKRHLPLVLDEFNSISCGSTSPAAWEFPSSLWGVHALLEAATDGAASVDIQTNPSNCNSYTPLCVPSASAPGTLEARPIFAAMQLVSGLEGGRLLRTVVGSTQQLPTGVSEYAVRLPSGDTAVVVDNTTASDVSGLNLQLKPTSQLLSVESLQAPSPDASTGITLTTTAASGSPTGLTVPADSVEVYTLTP